MKIASWNVNSLRVRLPQVLDWLAAERPDLLALQETKVADEEFPLLNLKAAGYHAVYAGQKGYNGVAILSRVPPAGDICLALPGIIDPQRRFLAARYGKLLMVSVYVPNGQEVGSDAYDYKLAWMERLRSWLKDQLAHHRDLVVTGDFNVAPEERDVYNPTLWANSVLFSGPERAAFHRLLDIGLVDLVRRHHSDDDRLYSWWDYRFNAFRKNQGLRIDHLLVSPALAECSVSAQVDAIPRGWPRPSDHAPLIAEFQARRLG